MGYAKNLGKQYNAETAWSSLGAPGGWQDYYDAAAQAPKYQRLYKELSTIAPPPRLSDWSFDYAQTNPRYTSNLAGPQEIVSSLFSAVNNFPDLITQGALAGRFINLF